MTDDVVDVRIGLGDRVLLAGTMCQGVVIGFATYAFHEDEYLVRIHTPSGLIQEWWGESTLDLD